MYFNFHCKELSRQNNNKLTFRNRFKNNEITFSLMVKSYLHTITCLQHLPTDVSHFSIDVKLWICHWFIVDLLAILWQLVDSFFTNWISVGITGLRPTGPLPYCWQMSWQLVNLMICCWLFATWLFVLDW